MGRKTRRNGGFWWSRARSGGMIPDGTGGTGGTGVPPVRESCTGVPPVRDGGTALRAVMLAGWLAAAVVLGVIWPAAPALAQAPGPGGDDGGGVGGGVRGLDRADLG
jgi:hypothetical protein